MAATAVKSGQQLQRAGGRAGGCHCTALFLLQPSKRCTFYAVRCAAPPHLPPAPPAPLSCSCTARTPPAAVPGPARLNLRSPPPRFVPSFITALRLHPNCCSPSLPAHCCWQGGQSSRFFARRGGGCCAAAPWAHREDCNSQPFGSMQMPADGVNVIQRMKGIVIPVRNLGRGSVKHRCRRRW